MQKSNTLKSAGEYAFFARTAADQARSQLAGKVAQLIGSAESLPTAISGLSLHRYNAPTPPTAMTYEPSVALVVQGRKQVQLGQRTFLYDASRFLLTSVDLPVISQVVTASPKLPYLCLRLKLDIPVVRELLGRDELQVDPAPCNSPGMTTAHTTVDFLSAFSRLIDLLDTPQNIPFLSPLIQREIIYRILRISEGRRLCAIAAAGDQSQRAAKVITWIKANYAKPLRVEDLAQIAGMSMSTLHHHFRQLTTMSPIQYQKRLRLNEARRSMLMDGLDAASACFAVGYESASQFNREYRRVFGQPPIRDIRTLRSYSAS